VNTLTEVRLGLVAGLTALVLAGCTERTSLRGNGLGPAPQSHTASPTVDSVPLPEPDQRGPTVTVAGQLSWNTPAAGCVQLRTRSGQALRLTGQAVAGHLTEHPPGEISAPVDVVVTGHIPAVAASVCGPVPAFTVEKAATEIH
jgi:hypothetical protein